MADNKYKKYISGQDNNQDGDVDQYDYARSASAKQTLDSSIQLEAAKQNAQKTLGQQLQAQGLMGSGTGGAMTSGVQNQWLKAYNDNQQAGQQAINGINQQEASYNQQKADQEAADAKAEQQASYEDMRDLMGSTQDQSQLDSFLQQNGFRTADGQWGGESWDKLTDSQKQGLMARYGMYSAGFANQTEQQWLESHPQITSPADAFAMTTSNGSTGDTVKDEVNYIFNNPGDFQDGEVVQLTNGNDENNRMYMVKRNGGWYQATQQDYDAAENKTVLKGGKNMKKVEAEQKAADEKKAKEAADKAAQTKAERDTKYQQWLASHPNATDEQKENASKNISGGKDVKDDGSERTGWDSFKDWFKQLTNEEWFKQITDAKERQINDQQRGQQQADDFSKQAQQDLGDVWETVKDWSSEQWQDAQAQYAQEHGGENAGKNGWTEFFEWLRDRMKNTPNRPKKGMI